MTKNDIIEPFIKLRFSLDRLSLRDRAIILFLTIAGLLFLWYLLSYMPQNNSLNTITASIGNENTETAQLTEKRTMIQGLVKDDTVTKLTTKYKQLQTNIKELDNRITRFQKRFIDDRKLANLLNSILNQTDGVSMDELTNKSMLEQVAPIPVGALTPTSGTSGTTSTPTAPPTNTTTPNPVAQPAGQAIEQIHYKLILKGDYFSIMNYLEKLEQTEWQFYWDRFKYKVNTYPEATATIEFYTLRPAQAPAPANTGGGE